VAWVGGQSEARARVATQRARNAHEDTRPARRPCDQRRAPPPPPRPPRPTPPCPAPPRPAPPRLREAAAELLLDADEIEHAHEAVVVHPLRGLGLVRPRPGGAGAGAAGHGARARGGGCGGRSRAARTGEAALVRAVLIGVAMPGAGGGAPALPPAPRPHLTVTKSSMRPTSVRRRECTQPSQGLKSSLVGAITSTWGGGDERGRGRPCGCRALRAVHACPGDEAAFPIQESPALWLGPPSVPAPPRRRRPPAGSS
jgi:hypothetical protein